VNKKTSVKNTNLIFEELEPRLLLSADGLAVITESSVATLQNLAHTDNEHTMIVQQHAVQTSTSVQNNTQNNHRTELVILDSRVPNFQQLHNDIINAQQQGRDINVVILDAHRDGLEQISEALSKYNKLDAVHIVSHGSDGQLQLGATQLNNSTLKDRSSDISAWKEVFTDGGDLLIYGCNLAGTQDGKSLVDSLSHLTATDVAASDDLTGNRLLGGDWDLEYSVGEVETQIAFSENVQQQWNGTLAGITLESNQPVAGDMPDQSFEVKSGQPYGQTFMHDSAGLTYEVNEIDVVLYKASDATPGQTITVSIRDSWNGTILASATKSSDDLTVTEDWQKFDIGSVLLNDNTAYVIQIESDGIDKIYLGVQDSDAYANGDFLNSAGTPDTAKDTAFRVIQNTPPDARDDRIGLVFDGVDDYVRIGDYAGLNVSSNLTMEAWIKPTGAGTGSQIIINKEGEYEMGINATTGEMIWAFDNIDPDWSWHNTGHYVQADEWTHLAVTYNNGVVETFADGVLVDTYNGSGSIADTYTGFNELLIGGRENAVTQRFDGQIDEVRLWNTTQTQTDIQNNMGALLTGAETGLIGNWRLDEGSGITVVDQSAFGHDGTLADGVTVAEMPAWQGYVVSEDGTLNVTAVNGVLANDFDIEGDTLTAILVAGPANATAFTLNADGSFTYTPTADFNGIDSFTYRANDGSNNSNIATVTIRVNSVNDAPVANNDSYTVAEDQTLVINALTDNATASDLNAAWQFDEGTGTATSDATGNGNEGTINGATWTASSRTGDAALSFDGVNDYVQTTGSTLDLSTATEFTLSAWFQADTTTGQHHILWQGVTTENGWGEAPGTNAQSEMHLTVGRYDADDKITFFMGYHDTSAASIDITSASNFTDTSGWHQAVVVVSDLGGGTLQAELYVDGVLEGSDTGTEIDRSLWSSDLRIGQGGLSRNFDGLIDEVGIYDRSLTAAEINALYQTGILANDTDIDGDALSAILVSGPSDGILALNTDGSFSYTPDADFNGADSFTYKVNDGTDDSNTATVNITVTSVNDAPEINLDPNDDSGATGRDYITNFFDGDTPVDITDSDVSLIDVDTNLTSIIVTLTNEQENGNKELLDANAGSTGLTVNFNSSTDVLTISGPGTVADYLSVLSTVTYENTQNNPDTTDRIITFIADDGTDTSLIVTTTVRVFLGSPGNDAPVAQTNSVSAIEDNVFSFSSTDFTFIDVEGDALISATITNQILASGTLTHSGGTTVNDGDTLTAAQLDTLIYTPVADANGLPLATFDFAVNDVDPGTVFAQMDIDITSVNDVPTATTDGFTVDEGSTTILNLTLNDSDVDDGLDLTTITIVSGPVNGSINDNGDGTVDYIHDGTETIADSFTYNIKDLSGIVSNTVTVNLNINLLNDSPSATNDPGSYNADLSALNPLSYWRFGEAAGGTATDDGGTGNGAAFNGVTLGQAGAISGDADTAIGFDGIDDYVEIVHDPSYLIDDGTVQLWFNANDLLSDQGLFSKDSSGNDNGGHFTIRAMSNGSIEVRLQDNAVGDYFLNSSAGSFTASTWHHVAVTFGSNGMELYLDGVSVDTNSYTGGLGTSSGGSGNEEPIAIGASTRTSGDGSVTPLNDFFTGSIDEVAIFGQSLTADQIQNIYSSAVQNYSIAEDVTLIVAASEGVLINDTDEEGNSLTASLTSGPSNGSLTLNADGSFTYTPDANYSGVDTFTYVANDGNSDSNVATVTITISGDNDAPVNTVSGVQTILEDTQTAIAGISVADADAGTAAITTQLSVTAGVLDVTLSGTASITAGSNGSNTLTINGNVTDLNATLASLLYTGNNNVNGTAADTLIVTTNDLGNTGSGGAKSDIDNVQINITSVNDAPTVANAITDVTVNEDEAPTIIDISSVFADVDIATNADSLSYSVASSDSALVNASITGTTLTLTYVAGQSGGATITVTATDADGPVAVADPFTVTVNPVNDTPSVESVIPDQVLAEDFASYTLDLNAAFADVETADASLVYNVAGNTNINVSIASGIATITPTANWNGNETLTFTATDGGGLSVNQAVLFTVNPVNDAPTVANAITDVTVNEDAAPTIIDISSVFADVDIATNADSLSYSVVSSDGTLVNASITGTTLTLSYVAGQSGGTTITVTATDADGPVAVADPFTVTVNPVNDTPTVESVIPDQVLAEDFTSYTIDLNAAFADAETADASLVYNVTGDTNINVSIVSGIATITPSANWNGSETLTFSATDTGGLSVNQAVLFTVNPVNDAPVIAGVDTGSVTEDDDTDLDTLLETSGALTITDVDAGEAVFTIATINGTYGDLTIDAAGNWDYAADNTQAVIQNLGITDTLTDTVSVTSFDGTTHDIVITIGGINDAPTALNDTPVVAEGGVAIFDLAANDIDIDNALDLNSIAITGAPANGSLIVNGNGTVTYTHDGSETINDSFSYTIADITGAISNIATVNVTVTPTNDLPSAQDDAQSVDEGNTVNINLAANDTDIDSPLDLNSIAITGAPANGTLTVNANGTVDYAHDGSQTISDSFSYTISDISGAISNVATVSITVNPINNAPTTIGIIDVTVTEDSAPTKVDLKATFDDVDNLDSELTYSITGNTNIGLFSSAAVNAVTGELDLDYAADVNGSSQISIRATDPSGASVDTLFTVTVTPVNDTPVLVTNAGITAVGTSSTIISTAELNVNDIDNTDTVIVYTVTALPTNGELLLNGVPVTINSNFTEEDIINNNLSYQSDGTAANDQFAFTVSDGAGGTISNNSFNIVVQLTPPEPEERLTTEPEATADPVDSAPPADTNDESGGYGVPPPASEIDVEHHIGGSIANPIKTPLTLNPIPSIVLDQVERINVESQSVAIFSGGTTVAELQVKSITALWGAIDEMRQRIDENITEDITRIEFRSAAVSGAGVSLTAGVVAWVLRSGALMTSLMSTIPLWKGYDPLPILAYKDNEEEEENITEDKIPTSLEELRKIKTLKEKINKHNQVDNLFDGSEVKG
jgi:VCBS repeat-containing protein